MKISFEDGQTINDLSIYLDDDGCKIIVTNPYRQNDLDLIDTAEYYISKEQLNTVLGSKSEPYSTNEMDYGKNNRGQEYRQ